MATKKKADATIGKGTTVEFISFGFIGQATDLTFDGMGDVDDIDVTNFDSPEAESDEQWGGMEYEPATCGDPGTITMSVILAQDQKLPPIGKKDTIRVTLPLKAGYKSPTIWSGTGYRKGGSARAETRTAYVQTLVIRCSGVWTRSAAVKNA